MPGKHVHEWIKASDIEWQCNQCGLSSEDGSMERRLDLMELEYKARAKRPSAISARERINRWNDYHKQIDPERG